VKRCESHPATRRTGSPRTRAGSLNAILIVKILHSAVAEHDGNLVRYGAPDRPSGDLILTGDSDRGEAVNFDVVGIDDLNRPPIPFAYWYASSSDTGDPSIEYRIPRHVANPQLVSVSDFPRA
jgi:hypothetical protein